MEALVKPRISTRIISQTISFLPQMQGAVRADEYRGKNTENAWSLYRECGDSPKVMVLQKAFSER